MTIGDKAPEVLGKDENGKDIKLSDFRGRKLVLYFYPKDNTSGCTAEACSLRDHHQQLQSAGYEVVGVSKDSAASHIKFKEKYELPFPLIADVDRTLMEAMGAPIKMIHNVAPSMEALIRNDMLNGTAAQYAMVNGDISASGTCGWSIPAYVTQMNRSEELAEVVTNDIKIKLGYIKNGNVMVEPQWITTT